MGTHTHKIYCRCARQAQKMRAPDDTHTPHLGEKGVGGRRADKDQNVQALRTMSTKWILGIKLQTDFQKHLHTITFLQCVQPFPIPSRITSIMIYIYILLDPDPDWASALKAPNCAAVAQYESRQIPSMCILNPRKFSQRYEPL